MMTAPRVYYIRYIDPKTGFQKREEFDTTRERTKRIEELKKEGVTTLAVGSYFERKRVK